MLQIKWGILLKHQSGTNKQTWSLQQHEKAWRMLNAQHKTAKNKKRQQRSTPTVVFKNRPSIS
jgi:hypothetical protein